MNWYIIIQFVLGLVILISGAELLVRGASRFATTIGISPLIIGLTIVAFGTSSPEFVVSLKAGLSGYSDISIGNVVGSNVFNVLFILGISAIIRPLFVSHQLIRLDVPIMLLSAIMVFILGFNGSMDRLDGTFLTVGVIVYTFYLLKMSKKPDLEDKDAFKQRETFSLKALLINLAFILTGLGMLILGTNWFINGSIFISDAMGVSQRVIGLTIVAAGTSLPELATSIIAAIRNEQDIAVGNIVGSNIFNVLGVLGVTCMASPQSIPLTDNILYFDVLVMIAISIVCLPFFTTGHKIARWEGIYFIIQYTIYIAILIYRTESRPIYKPVWIASFLFILPAVTITIATIVMRKFRHPFNNVTNHPTN